MSAITDGMYAQLDYSQICSFVCWHGPEACHPVLMLGLSCSSGCSVLLSAGRTAAAVLLHHPWVPGVRESCS